MILVRPKLLAALTAAALLLLGAASPAAASPTADSPAPATGYAALGDSYAAGVGAGAYDQAGGDCHRSTRGYPALLAARAKPSAFQDVACTGATAASVLSDQLPAVPTGTAGLVTLTVGGNDLDFVDAVTSCLQPFTTEGKCNQALDHSTQLLRDQLPGALDRLLTGIGQAQPSARVVVTGYPHLLETGTTCFVATTSERKRFNALTDQLDDVLRQRTAAQGDRFRFADPRPAFAGHGICTAHGPEWINRIVLTPLWESFHPTADGQSLGYLPTVATAVTG
ncbi:lysophospholipase L1-like esterase [Kitasatospora sp. MAP12-15]|uniref:SGNH/GDSL hydrolase family protein n=1 Tax=unclassified Kitasatospora TaxID=2633591 RepID=UPI002475069B|nr:SGNH/GDSL hydrolase family protein [Kitasatospora sp. MAP12-44]MDH6109587.1 lysophospholipase L1-like esterase [Kitasatospora sp. MAP12-44]